MKYVATVIYLFSVTGLMMMSTTDDTWPTPVIDRLLLMEVLIIPLFGGRWRQLFIIVNHWWLVMTVVRVHWWWLLRYFVVCCRYTVARWYDHLQWWQTLVPLIRVMAACWWRWCLIHCSLKMMIGVSRRYHLVVVMTLLMLSVFNFTRYCYSRHSTIITELLSRGVAGSNWCQLWAWLNRSSISDNRRRTVRGVILLTWRSRDRWSLTWWLWRDALRTTSVVNRYDVKLFCCYLRYVLLQIARLVMMARYLSSRKMMTQIVHFSAWYWLGWWWRESPLYTRVEISVYCFITRIGSVSLLWRDDWYIDRAVGRETRDDDVCVTSVVKREMMHSTLMRCCRHFWYWHSRIDPAVLTWWWPVSAVYISWLWPLFHLWLTLLTSCWYWCWLGDDVSVRNCSWYSRWRPRSWWPVFGWYVPTVVAITDTFSVICWRIRDDRR